MDALRVSGAKLDEYNYNGSVAERSALGLSIANVNETNETILFTGELIELNSSSVIAGLAYNWSNRSLPTDSGFASALYNVSEPSKNIPWWEVIPYPQSGYSQLSIIILAFFITCIMILIVIGNLLVCVAISTEKSLKTIQNWFITSLAVSDLLLGLVIVPFSLAQELMGYWIFGTVWCDIHHALDVLLTTASINNLCLISLDRYWSVTQAVEYLKKRTPTRAMYMIIFVWVFSACVSLPPLVGWKNTDLKEGECELSNDIGYVLYSSLGSFYIPTVVMVFVYAKIFVAARSRARKHVKKKQLHTPSEITNDPTNNKSTTTTTCTSLSNPSPPDINKEESVSESVAAERTSTPPTPLLSQPQQQTKVTFCLKEDKQQKDVKESKETNVAKQCNESLSVSPTMLSPPEIVIETLETPHSSPKRTFSKKYEDSDTVDSPVTKTSLAPESKSFLSAPKLSRSPFGSTLSIADFDDSEMCNDAENGSQKKKRKAKVQYDNSAVPRHI
ncbi:alpha-2A adrenergic receptor-like protein, partial [Leptotrombidium deliense]